MTPKPSYRELEKKIAALESKIILAESSPTRLKNELHRRLEHHEAFADIITNDKKMLSIFQYVELIALTTRPVLITGETGVGKELIARTLHKLSNRTGEFVPLNVSGLDENIFSDTLFGHVKGAFTGAETVRRGIIEKAAGGTLLLDEIGDLPPSSQVKLLRVLQEAEYLPLGRDESVRAEARIISTTNKDLWALQRTGHFREDLNFRLRTHHIHVPPLRERKGDIHLLLDHFIKASANALEKTPPKAPRELQAFLNAYRFPGNIRELQIMVFDAVSRSTSTRLSLAPFKETASRENAPLAPGGERAELFSSLRELPNIREATQWLVDEAMQRACGNQTRAAKMLGLSQQAISKRLKGKGA